MMNSLENHETSNGEMSKSPPVTPPPPVSGYAVAVGQQNHVDSPLAQLSQAGLSRMSNHVTLSGANSSTHQPLQVGNSAPMTNHVQGRDDTFAVQLH